MDPQQSKSARAKRRNQKREGISEDFTTYSKRDWGTRKDDRLVKCVLRNVRKVGGRENCYTIIHKVVSTSQIS